MAVETSSGVFGNEMYLALASEMAEKRRDAAAKSAELLSRMRPENPTLLSSSAMAIAL